MYRIAIIALFLEHLLFLVSRKAGGTYITDDNRLLRYECETMQQIFRCKNCDI